MFRFEFILISWTIFVSVISASDFPSDVERCTYSDSECLSAVVTQILRTHSKGHRGLNMIPIDPLHIKSLVLPKIPNSPVNVEFRFKDIDLTGISQASVSKVSGFAKEPSDLVLELHAHFPTIALTGPYSIDGQVLILTISGKGNSKIVFDELKAIAKLKCTILEKDGEKYLNIVKVHLDLQPQKTTFDLENLFNGDKVLGDNMNRFLNDNWEEMYSQMKPVIVEAIGKIVLHIANGVFSKIPYTDLFLPS